MSAATVTPTPAPTDVLTAFTWYADAVRCLPADALADLVDAYDSLRGRKRRRVADIAQRASDLAYDLGRIAVPDDADLPEGITDEEYDTASAGTVIGAPRHLASVHDLLQLDEVLGVALIIGLAILTYDQLADRDYEELTSWWAAAGGPLPTTFNGPDRKPGKPADADAEQPEQQRPPRRKRVAPPAGAVAPTPKQVRSRRTRSRAINRSTPVLLGFLIVLLIIGAFASVAMGFAFLAMGRSVDIWFVSIGVCSVGAVITAAVRQQTLVGR